MYKDLKHGRTVRLGFVVNPYAGAGGPAALKGSDSLITKEAIVQGEIAKRAPERAQQFIAALQDLSRYELILPSGEMGLALLSDEQRAHFSGVYPLTLPMPTISSGDTTIAVVNALLDARVDLLVFVGGDGTARDVCSAVDDKTPVLGVPSGVKMHSGVFAISPVAAAKVVNAVAAGDIVSFSEQEVRDIDEEAFQQGVVRSRYFGEMWTPDEVRYLQHVKQGGMEVDELVLLDIAEDIRESLEQEEFKNALVIFSTGSTTQFVQSELGCEGTLLGVDVVSDGGLLAKDVDASQLEAMVDAHNGPVIIIATAIGGQGHIVGRGNQQLSPKVLRRVGRDNLWVVMTKAKLNSLEGRPLLMDSNDASLDASWQGFIPVITGYRDRVLYRLGVEDE